MTREHKANQMADARLQRLSALAASQKQTDALPVKKPREKIQAKVLFAAEKILEASTKGFVVEQSPESSILQNRVETLSFKPPTDAPNASRLSKELKEQYATLEEFSDESEEDVQPVAPLLRPVFVRKEARQQVTAEPLDKAVEAGRKAREQEAHELLVQFVRREYEASSTAHGDPEGGSFDPSTVDDNDDPDCQMELEAWKLRELLRIKRDRREREKWEREKIELERIRNMTEEERRQLDEAKMKEWIEQPKSQMRFMQKYYHKGAFFMDGNESIYSRDYAQPTGEDASANREILPEVKQVRDFGKKGRTKWTHLVGEDTTEFSYGWGQRKNELNYKMVNKMGGMRGHLNNPSKRPKT